MLKKAAQVPLPETVEAIPPHLLDGIRTIVPPDRYSHTKHRAEAFLPNLPEDTGDLPLLIQPIARTAIRHYREDEGVEPTHAEVFVRHAAISEHFSDMWHRDPLFPGGKMYIVSSHDSTEFAAGDGMLLLALLPEQVSINGLTNRLIHTGCLERVPTAPHQLTVFGGKHIHRRPKITRDGRISVEISLFNSEQARQTITGNPVRYFGSWRKLREQERNDPYGI